MIDHADIVQQLHGEDPPAKTLEGALAFLLRVVARLQDEFPSERVGLLIKTAGENIVPYGGNVRQRRQAGLSRPRFAGEDPVGRADDQRRKLATRPGHPQ